MVPSPSGFVFILHILLNHIENRFLVVHGQRVGVTRQDIEGFILKRGMIRPPNQTRFNIINNCVCLDDSFCHTSQLHYLITVYRFSAFGAESLG
jgi:hypothetical protein